MSDANKDDVLNFFASDAKSAHSHPPAAEKKPSHQHKDSFDPFSGGQASGSTDDLSDLMGGGSGDGKAAPAAKNDLADLVGGVKGTQTKPALAPVKEAAAAQPVDAPLAAGSLDSSLFGDLNSGSSAARKDDQVDLI